MGNGEPQKQFSYFSLLLLNIPSLSRGKWAKDTFLLCMIDECLKGWSVSSSFSSVVVYIGKKYKSGKIFTNTLSLFCVYQGLGAFYCVPADAKRLKRKKVEVEKKVGIEFCGEKNIARSLFYI